MFDDADQPFCIVAFMISIDLSVYMTQTTITNSESQQLSKSHAFKLCSFEIKTALKKNDSRLDIHLSMICMEMIIYARC